MSVAADQAKAFAPSPEQLAVRARGGQSNVLVAAAGSGKTRVLTWLYCDAHLEQQIGLDRLLAISFTDKAAAELRKRIADELRPQLLGAEPDLGEAWIGTFHSTCTRILREYAHHLRLDPAFGVIDELASTELRAEAWEAALTDVLQAPGSDAAMLLAQVGEQALSAALINWWEARRSAGEVHPQLPVPAVGAADVIRLAARFASAAAELTAQIEELREQRTTVAKTLESNLAVCSEAVEVAARIEAGLHDGTLLPGASGAAEAAARLAAELERSKPRNGAPMPKGAPEIPAFLQTRAALAQALHELHAGPVVALIAQLAAGFSRHYEQAKADAELLDFDDLELKALQLLRANEGVRKELAERFERIYVDEFQDTNPRQAELVDLLAGGQPWAPAAGEGRASVTVVGDPRQAIYGFRHADVALIKQAELALPDDARLRLTTNYRSQAEILSVIDDAFARLEDDHAAVTAGRDDSAPLSDGEPRVELLVTKEDPNSPWSDIELGAAAGEEGSPALAERRLVAARIAELRAAEPGRSIVVLARSHAILAALAAALGDAGIPVLADGADGFWERLEVADVVAWLQLVRNPADDDALVRCCASPLLALSTDAIAALGLLERGPGRNTRTDALRVALEDGVFAEEDAARLRGLFALLAAQRDPGRRSDPAGLIDQLLELTRYDEHLLRLPDGDRRVANLVRLRRVAARAAADGLTLAELLDRAELERRYELRVPEAATAGEGAVRLMTVHQAKGLEFDTVFVVGLGGQVRSTSAPILGDAERLGLRLRPAPGAELVSLFAHTELLEAAQTRELAELKRVLYVALTRAENRLIISGVANWKKNGDDPFKDPAQLRPSHIRSGGQAPKPATPAFCWLAPALVPEIDRLPLGAEGGVVRTDAGIVVRVSTPSGTVLPEHLRAPEILTRPVHRPAPLDASAVPATTGVALPGPAKLSYTGLSRHRDCALRFYGEQVLGLGALGTSETAPLPPPTAGDGAQLSFDAIAAPLMPEPSSGPTAAELGTLVHAALEHLPPSAPATDIAREVRTAGYAMGLTLDDETATRAQALTAAGLASPLSAELWAGGQAPRRELPFTIAIGAGAQLITGVIDAWRDGGEGQPALIVDYKTDRIVDDADLEGHTAARYALQRAAYALAALRSGVAEVRVAHLFLAGERAPVAEQQYRQEDASALEAALIEAAQATQRAEEPPPTRAPHRFICDGCPLRGTRCGWAVAATQRHPDDPLPGPELWAGRISARPAGVG